MAVSEYDVKESDGTITHIVETQTVIGSSSMSGKNNYSFCPACFKQLGGKDEALSPLRVLNVHVKQTATFQNGVTKQYKTFDKVYLCSRCGHRWQQTELEDQYIAKANEGG